MVKKLYLINGKGKSGKDTFSDFLINYTKGTKYSFATKIKEIVSKIFNITVEQLNELKNNREPFSNCKSYLPTKIETDFRTILERTGDEAMKPVFGSTVWVKLIVDQIKKDKPEIVVISDFRFMEEHSYIQQNLTDYEIITVNVRRGETLESSHKSNQELPLVFDETIPNYGTLEELEIEALKLVLTEDILDDYWFTGDNKIDYQIEYKDYWIEKLAEVFYGTNGYKNWLRDNYNV